MKLHVFLTAQVLLLMPEITKYKESMSDCGVGGHQSHPLAVWVISTHSSCRAVIQNVPHQNHKCEHITGLLFTGIETPSVKLVNAKYMLAIETVSKEKWYPYRA